MYRNHGFTLVELMIAIAIGAILLTIGIPSYQDFIQRNTVTTTSNDLVGALLYARSEAVRQESDVTFTPEENGWTVKARVNDEDTILLEYAIENSKLSLAEQIENGASITYNSRGRASVSAGDSFDISYNDNPEVHVCIALTGRPYIKKTTDGDCP
jgi:type IV fimbrial biogenesis protein FimT